ncbi:MAG: hypothetical protein AAF496_15400 [Pseudomonadota bacterium]
MRKVISGIVVTSFLTACAASPDKVSSAYVSPGLYEDRTCSELMEERNQIASNVNRLSAEQKKASTTDAVATGVALVLFWPAAFALAATQDQSNQLAQAKGNYDAITTQMTKKNCKVPPVIS